MRLLQKQRAVRGGVMGDALSTHAAVAGSWRYAQQWLLRQPHGGSRLYPSDPWKHVTAYRLSGVARQQAGTATDVMHASAPVPTDAPTDAPTGVPTADAFPDGP